MTPRLTVTYGLRWVLEAPPYETNGLQVAPCVEAAGGGCTNQNVADWFNHTAQLASQGMSANMPARFHLFLADPKITVPACGTGITRIFRRASPWLGRRTPATDGSQRFSGKKDQFSIRGGYSIMYDHFGIPIVNSFDQHGSFGLSTDLGNPAGVVTVCECPALYLPCSGCRRASPACRSPVPKSKQPGLLVRPYAIGRFSGYSKQYRLCHQLGAGSDVEDALCARLQFLALAANYVQLIAADCLCGQHWSASPHAGRSGDARQSHRPCKQDDVFSISHDALEGGRQHART